MAHERQSPPEMTGADVILVAVTSALVAVFTMLLVATIRRARARDDEDET